MSNLVATLKAKAHALKRQSLTVYFAARDPRTPILVRVLALLIAAYAFSPVDLIPDFIPVLGYLDDLVLIPLGVALVVRLVPSDVIEAARVRAAVAVEQPTSYLAATCVVAVWLAASFVFLRWAYGAVDA